MPTAIKLRAAAPVTEEEALTALEIEQAQLPAKIQEAANEGDAARLIALRSRADDLPTALKAARAAILRRRIAQLESSLSEARAHSEGHNEELRAAENALKAAQEAHSHALTVAGNALSDVQWTSADLRSAKDELAGLVNELALPLAPIVRARNVHTDNQASWG